jgi:two-component system, OmpR family, sensor kinase
MSATPSRFNGMSLRARLVTGTVVLLAVVFAVVGFLTVFALRDFLVDQVDNQLTSAQARSDRGYPPPGNGGPQTTTANNCPGDNDAGPLGAGQAAGTVGVHICNGTVNFAKVLNSNGTAENLPATDVATLTAVPVSSTPTTVHLGQLGDYRVLASRAPDGDTVITGLPLASANDTVERLTIVILVVGLIGLLVAALGGAAIVRWTLKPLRRVAATATRVSTLQLDRGEVSLPQRVAEPDADPRTEVGRVGAALNRMLEHVGAALEARQQSETRVRQFVADASHELRTPLAAIRGYAELPRRSREILSPDVSHALGRVESEATRMSVLVDDLLLLARLDSGRPLESTPVDLSRLVVDVVGDARVAGPGHRWQLELPEEAVAVTGDAARLHQVLANLLANARTHTPAGTTVTVSLAEPETGQVRLAVIDDGPGIEPDLLPTIFERFARGDTSRARNAGGTASTGLGLAIVAAVVEAHGGSVSAASRPGRTEFALLLPAATPATAATSTTAATADGQPAPAPARPGPDSGATVSPDVQSPSR